MESDEQAIRQAHSTWIDALNAADLPRLLNLMADDCLFLNTGQAPLRRDGFPSVFLTAHQQARIHCTSDLQDVVVVGPVAYTHSRDSLTITPRSGGPTTRLAGHRLSVYRQHPDGRWLLARDAHTLSPAE
jgi:uncharacterized protein (TIGR02246 family)